MKRRYAAGDSQQAIDLVGIFADRHDEDDAREAELRVGSVHISGNASASGSEDVSFAAGATTCDTSRGSEACSAAQTGVGQPLALVGDDTTLGAQGVTMTPKDKDTLQTLADPALPGIEASERPLHLHSEPAPLWHDPLAGAKHRTKAKGARRSPFPPTGDFESPEAFPEGAGVSSAGQIGAAPPAAGRTAEVTTTDVGTCPARPADWRPS